MQQEPFNESQFVPASVVLERLHRAAPKDEVTVRWVLDRLDRQSFGLVLLLLGIAAVVPGVCTIAGLLIAILGLEMAAGHAEPYFPRWIVSRPLPARYLRPIVSGAIAVLWSLERAIHPRWLPWASKLRRVVGVTVFLASARLILVPIPFSNVLPAVVIATIALAYLEEDALFLVIMLGLAAGNLALDYALVWETLGHL